MMRRALLVLAIGGLAAGCEHQCAPVEYEIPEGFSGWVTVRYAAPDAPPLPTRGRVRIARIPPSGLLRTATPQEFGIQHDSYFFVGAAGRRPAVDADATDYQSKASTTRFPQPVVCCPHYGSRETDGVKRRYSGFFVGRGPAGEPPEWPVTP